MNTWTKMTLSHEQHKTLYLVPILSFGKEKKNKKQNNNSATLTDYSFWRFPEQNDVNADKTLQSISWNVHKW